MPHFEGTKRGFLEILSTFDPLRERIALRLAKANIGGTTPSVDVVFLPGLFC